ncbi:AMP-binding protein [Azoarcus sp. DN11]|uniref:AMP-binding protein n=1 Tax=Azoarcus sp. DN11 TaxID=356837 RepID=UPI000EB15730|nr:AMP-binding protein [Azoarcus sp. DN11]AYH43550.1 hypothetical protein CDA09_09165 [Azoarcus sp. DN11]
MEIHATLPRLAYQHALNVPDQIALVSIGQGSVTWGELWDSARRWAGWLEANGVRPGDRVASLAPQSLEGTYLWMGCAAAGAVEVSINNQFRGEWLRHALRVSSAKVVVLARKFLEQALAVIDGTGVETILVYDAPNETFGADCCVKIVTASPESAPPGGCDGEPQVFPHDIACILYTSGTTGVSKAVEIPWALLHHTAATYGLTFERGPNQVFYFPYSAYHLSGRDALYSAALTGGRSVVRDVFSTSSFWDDIREHGCTWTLLFAATARFLASVPESPDDLDNPLELVLINPLLPETDALRRRFGFRTYATYGMTETGITLVTPPDHAMSAHAGCCGRPVEGLEVRLVDPHDHAVGPGEVGELVVRGRDPWMITTGYQGAPEATVKAWRNGWFHSGDLFRVDAQGYYYYIDRSKDMIRRRGENISSFELESAVLTHATIAEAAAVGVASPLGDEEVLIAVVAKPGKHINPLELVSYLQERVPRFAVPRYVRILDELPKTQSTMRVQRQVLRSEGIADGTWDRAEAVEKAVA